MCILKNADVIQHLKRANLMKELGLPVSALNTLIYKRKIIEENHNERGSSASKNGLKLKNSDVGKFFLK